MRNHLSQFIRYLREAERHPDWPEVRRAWLAKYPNCAHCGEQHDCQVHHIQPYHLFPDLELVETNFITLGESIGRNCHLLVGHLGNWKKWNARLIGVSPGILI